MISDREHTAKMFEQLCQILFFQTDDTPETMIESASKIIDQEYYIKDKLNGLALIAKINLNDRINHWVMGKAAEIMENEQCFADSFSSFLYRLITHIPNCPFLWCYLQHQCTNYQDQFYISLNYNPDTIQQTREIINADFVKKELAESEFQTQPVFMDACIAYVTGNFVKAIDLVLFSFNYPAPEKLCLISEQILDISFRQLATCYQEFFVDIDYQNSIYYILSRYHDMEYEDAIRLCDNVLLNADQVSDSDFNKIWFIKASSLESLKLTREALEFYTGLYKHLIQDRKENYYLINRVKFNIGQLRKSFYGQSIFTQQHNVNSLEFFDNSLESPMKKRKF